MHNTRANRSNGVKERLDQQKQLPNDIGQVDKYRISMQQSGRILSEAEK
jgi:hypothetical protein